MVSVKGSGKYNFCYALTNKVGFKASLDEAQRMMDEFEKDQQDSNDEVEEEAEEPASEASKKKKP